MPDLSTLLRLQAGYNDQQMDASGKLMQTIGNIAQDRGQRSFQQDAIEFFKDGNISPQRIQQFSQMYPNVDPQETWKVAAAVSSQREAQEVKDAFGTVGDLMAQNRGRPTPEQITTALQGKSPAAVKTMMTLMQQYPEVLKLWKNKYVQTNPEHDIWEEDPITGERTKVYTGLTAGKEEEKTTEGRAIIALMKEINPATKKNYTYNEAYIAIKKGADTSSAPEWKAYVDELMMTVNPETGKPYTKIEAIKHYQNLKDKPPPDKEMKLFGLIDMALDPSDPKKQAAARQALTLYKETMAQNLIIGGTASGDIVTGKTRGPLSPTVVPGVGEKLIDVKSQPLPEKAEDKLTGALDMFDLLKVLEKNSGVGVPIPGVGEATTYVQSKLGSKAAQDFLTAKNQLKANAQTIIKGIPSNFDVETFIATLPSETDTAQEKMTKIAQSKKLLMNAVTTGIQNYEGSKYEIPKYVMDRYKRLVSPGVTDGPAKKLNKADILKSGVLDGKMVYKLKNGSTVYEDGSFVQ